jgi:hypothetical protein
MQESFIKVDTDNKVTSFVGPDATKLAQAVTIRAALRLWQAGIQPSPAATKTQTLAMASTFTGKKYGRGAAQLDQAIADMDVWVVTMRAGLPIIRDDQPSVQ